MALDNWQKRLQECSDAELAGALVRSIEALFMANRHALIVDAAERNIAHRLAGHIGGQALMAPDGQPWDVDVEYNRQRARVKTINGGTQVVVPDLILHRIDSEQNYLVMELKKGSSSDPDPADLSKLHAYRYQAPLFYRHALFLRLGVGDAAGTVSCIAWV